MKGWYIYKNHDYFFFNCIKNKKMQYMIFYKVLFMRGSLYKNVYPLQIISSSSDNQKNYLKRSVNARIFITTLMKSKFNLKW